MFLSLALPHFVNETRPSLHSLCPLFFILFTSQKYLISFSGLSSSADALKLGMPNMGVGCLPWRTFAPMAFSFASPPSLGLSRWGRLRPMGHTLGCGECTAVQHLLPTSTTVGHGGTSKATHMPTCNTQHGCHACCLLFMHDTSLHLRLLSFGIHHFCRLLSQKRHFEMAFRLFVQTHSLGAVCVPNLFTDVCGLMTEIFMSAGLSIHTLRSLS